MKKFPWGKIIDHIEVSVMETRKHVLHSYFVTAYHPYKIGTKEPVEDIVQYHSEDLHESSEDYNYMVLALMIFCNSESKQPQLARGLATMVKHL